MNAKLISENNYAAEMEPVMKALHDIRRSGTFARKPGENIYYELYDAPDAVRWVAISHGFTESTVKYAEVIWYFLQQGCSVAICDHRGHGRSYRRVPETWLTNVERFEDYSDDFAFFIRNVIEPELKGLPLVLMGHSMGGAVAAQVVERFPELPIRKLVLSSPMIAPATNGLPAWVSLTIARFFGLIGKGRTCVFVHHPFTGADEFGEEWCCALSESRNSWYLNIQRRTPSSRTPPPPITGCGRLCCRPGRCWTRPTPSGFRSRCC